MATPARPRALLGAVQSARWTRLSRRPIATAAVSRDPPTVDPRIPSVAPALPSPPERRQKLRDAKPFSDFLTDTFDRQHDYLRISLTERCNLRCTYCMPAEGIQLSPDREILTTPEIYYLSALFVNQGVNKIRLTGGEPTVRKDIVPLMQQIGSLRRNGLKELALTTNGISLHRKLDDMVEAGLTGVNISLDTLDPLQFPLLTRRNGFNAVMKSIDRVQELNRLGAGVKLKINCVAMRGINNDQILKFVEMTREQDLEVRFIEYMPFGGNRWAQKKMLPYAEMVDLIKMQYPTLARLRGAKNDTSKTWQVPGFVGRVGFITSMTHNFCGSCNRLRITSDGNLKVCLHGNAEVSLRDLLRADNAGNPMDEEAFQAVRQLELDKTKAAQGNLRRLEGGEGWITKERQLLEVIGAAVKRKAAKHADMGDLENMQNRPMILIGKPGLPQFLSNASQHPSIKHPRSTPWSRVPLHVLQPTHLLPQARYYSSDSGQNADDDTCDKKVDSESAPRLATSFGFQSLTGLFEQPTRARYSIPQVRRDDINSETQVSSNREEPVTRSETVPAGTENFFQANSSAAQETVKDSSISPPNEAHAKSSGDSDAVKTSAAQQQNIPVAPANSAGTGIDATYTPRQGETQREQTVAEIGEAFRRRFAAAAVPQNSDSERKTPSSSGTSTARRQSGLKKSSEHITKSIAGIGGKMRANPFPSPPNTKASRDQPTLRLRKPAVVTSHAENPWGLSTEDGASTSTNSTRGPGVHEPSGAETLNADPPVASTKDTASKSRATSTSPSKTRAKLEPSQWPSTATSSSKPGKTSAKENLTHLTSTGEAHMVDVGGKQSTRRVAVARSRVRFSNGQPYDLISENCNKKGDVLGVARIAGIMAAKRTSDMIPLCHPIAISKVEVDVQLEKLYNHGAVSVLAQVECTGPTGVEMEALTAATAATLTVFDMCKAVDKYMEIGAGRVLYKNGGKSGLTAKISWATEMGAEWFIERGLEVPKGVKMKSNIGEAEKEQEGEAKKEEGEDGDVPRSDSDVENSAKVIRKCVVRRQFRRSIRPA